MVEWTFLNAKKMEGTVDYGFLCCSFFRNQIVLSVIMPSISKGCEFLYSQNGFAFPTYMALLPPKTKRRTPCCFYNPGTTPAWLELISNLVYCCGLSPRSTWYAPTFYLFIWLYRMCFGPCINFDCTFAILSYA